MLQHPWESMCCAAPGKQCLVSPLGTYVLDQPWETMCCQLCSAAFGSPALVPSFGPLFWAPVLGRHGPWPIGPVCVASPLGHYVLHQSLETMCCIALRKLCVVSPLGNYVLHDPWESMCCISPGKLMCCITPGNNVLRHPWETMCWVGPVKLCVVSFGPQLLGPQLWFPALVRCFGPQFWADMAHGPLGQYVLHHFWDTMCCISPWKLCVASPLGNYVLYHPWETMCCITLGKLRVASSLGKYVLHQPWERMCCITPGKLCVASPLGHYVLHHPWKSMCCTAPVKQCVASPLGNHMLHQPWEAMCYTRRWLGRSESKQTASNDCVSMLVSVSFCFRVA